MSSGPFSVQVDEDIDAFAVEDWDSILDPDDLQASHRFVKVCQRSGVESARYAHVLIRDGYGSAGLASLSAFPVSIDLLAPKWTRGIGRAIRDRFPGFLRFSLVVGGLPVSFNQSCLRVRRDVEPGTILGLLEPEVEKLAEEAGASILCFKEFSDGEMATARPLEDMGFVRCSSLPSCILGLPFSSFDEYLASMRSGYRRQLKATAKPPDASGLVLRLEPLGPHVGRVFPLYEQVMDRADYQLERLNEGFFRSLSEDMPDETRVLLLEDDNGDLLTAAVLLRGPRKTTFLVTGIDYRRSREVRAYEKLVTAVIAQAICWGAEAVELGQTSWALKGRLGARPSPRHLFFRHRRPVGNRILGSCLPYLFPDRRLAPRRVFRHAE